MGRNTRKGIYKMEIITNPEEFTEEALEELSNGKGDDDEQ